MKDAIKRLFDVFLICHFIISMIIAICGLIAGQDHELSYSDMFDPALLAFLCTLPTFLTMRTERLTISQLVMRKIVQLVIIEGIVVSLLYLGNYGLQNVKETFIVTTAVFVAYLVVSIIDWISGYIEAQELNRKLAQMKTARKDFK